MNETRRPRVGVGVAILREGRVLLGRRRGAHGSGTWQFPGGHLEWFEEVEDCARREVREETGIELGAIRRVHYTNDRFEEDGAHYVTLFVVAEHGAGEARLLEPDQCEAWEWFSWKALPEPLFLPIRNLLARGFDPFASGS